MKKIAVALMGVACIASTTAFAAAGEVFTIKSSNTDSVEVVQVFKTNDKNYYQYYNSQFGYTIDIPKTATQADVSENGDGCYFQIPKDRSVITTYAAKNSLGFSVDELYNMDVGVNGSPKLSTDIKTKNSYIIAWTDGKVSYYHELYVNEKDKSYTAFSVTYPTNKKGEYADIITHMNRSFIPNGVKMEGRLTRDI
jgi:hypothetical protein